MEAKRRKTIFYDEFKDRTLKFKDGKTLGVNMTMLALESEIFREKFKETTSSACTIEIKDYCFEDFKIFLNCMLEIEECNFEKALTLLPIACRYETLKFIKKCVDILTPVSKPNSNVCQTLNLAVSCKCTQLEDAIIKFLLDSRYIYFLLSDREHLYLDLEPVAMVKLLEKVVVDSYIVRAIFQWGKNYFKKNNFRKNKSLKCFFDETAVSPFISVFSFESIQALVDFNESELGANYFTLNDISCYVKANERSCDNRNVSWFEVKAGDVLVEKLLVKNAVLLADKIGCSVKVRKHPCVFYERSQRPDEKLLECQYTYQKLKTKEVESKSLHFSNNQICSSANYFCGFNIHTEANIVSDIEIKSERTFHADCRILKGSAKNFEVDGNENDLYFTKEIQLTHFEKGKKK